VSFLLTRANELKDIQRSKVNHLRLASITLPTTLSPNPSEEPRRYFSPSTPLLEQHRSQSQKFVQQIHFQVHLRVHLRDLVLKEDLKEVYSAQVAVGYNIKVKLSVLTIE
jgi:hypothetical protein